VVDVYAVEDLRLGESIVLYDNAQLINDLFSWDLLLRQNLLQLWVKFIVLVGEAFNLLQGVEAPYR
jgi:hypothetical protein